MRKVTRWYLPTHYALLLDPVLLLKEVSSMAYVLINWHELEWRVWGMHLALTIMGVKYK